MEDYHVTRANIFVIGMDDENLSTLRDVPHAEDYRFHGLLTVEELQGGEVSFPDLLRKAQEQLDAFDGTVDAICGYWDFPVATLVPILCARYGLRSTSLESVVKCEHKYWSRLEQQKVIEEHPRFALVDLEGEPERPAQLSYPMWLKPVKSYSSELAFGVADDDGFRKAFEEIRQGISRVGRPFEHVLDRLELPPEVASAGGQACLAEETLKGEQVAVEGYVHEGEPHVYGVLDSVDYPGRSSFLRHQYPSGLPAEVQDRLREVSERVISQIGMDSATFSIEYFHDAETGEVKLLEINPRHSQSHAELFEYVDGVPNHHCMVSLALGRNPELPHREGPYAVAAKWYQRRFEDGYARRVPTDAEIRAVEREIPGTRIEVVPQQGRRLSDLEGQDSYSYELTRILIGAAGEEEMRAKYERCVELLPFEFDEVE
jgi:hypothetical protein